LRIGSGLLVSLASARRHFLVIAGHCGEGLVGDALVHVLAPDEAHDGVAALDVVVEEVERLAGIVGLEPEGDLAQLDSKWVEVDGRSTFARMSQVLSHDVDEAWSIYATEIAAARRSATQ